MKFTCTVIINKPLNQVIKLFDNPANLKEWQDGFISTELLNGKQGTKGAKSRIKLKAGKSIIELTETILVKNLPSEMTALYEHTQMDNTMSNRFTSIDTQTTQWAAEIHYTRINGFIPRIMATLLPGIFKKQTQKWLQNFKKFAESK